MMIKKFVGTQLETLTKRKITLLLKELRWFKPDEARNK